MVSKRFWKRPILEFVNLVKKEKKKRKVEILGTSFQILPGVFSPIHSTDTAWFAEKLIPLVKNKSLLEIGTGSGVIACLAAINGASKVVATDINPKAIENALINAKLHSVNISVRHGSVFNPIDKGEKFDVIFWNHPFYCGEMQEFQHHVDDPLISSVVDSEYQFLEDFFREGSNHLTPHGYLVLGTSNVAKINLIRKMARNKNYKLTLIEKMIVPIYKGKATKMDVRMYTLKK